jgi:hypothetical protein
MARALDAVDVAVRQPLRPRAEQYRRGLGRSVFAALGGSGLHAVDGGELRLDGSDDERPVVDYSVVR